ncbi:uncharacterized protein YbbK (DUF523 family) [Onishia taeanensis]|uniref:Uncharacterized protein YbbK (DUF523 family) n=1 Tax=Onishia taeanensis TaxID=284577 RepID=A0A328XYT9_9GAMM|nr:DUF523 domain-containing protein [Halomonas taeanensis]RAR64679.1 uncharacterized protein YbbK (DUF523 family) [Halomonas taeanensis]
MEKLLISACLLGQPVRYDGGAKALHDPTLERWRREGCLIAACPEVQAGMSTPRPPAEIQGGTGAAVLDGTARDGEDVSQAFLSGAEQALALCQQHDIRVAILTEASPSCGSRTLSDGSFTGHRVPGQGVTAALLERHGVRVFSQFELKQAERALQDSRA